jgi:lambda family phage minor tail protein L
MAVEPQQNERRKLSVGQRVELWELDYNRLVGGTLGNPVNMRFYCSDSQLDGTPVFLDGQQYDPIPIEGTKFDFSSEGAPPRPRLTIANGGGQVSAVIDSIGGDITGALVTRREILRKHLDDGSDPDPLAHWPNSLWVIERKTQETRHVVEFELASLADVSGVELPLRRIESQLCPWTYLSPECGWDNTVNDEPMFDKQDVFLGLVSGGAPHADDNCGLRRRSCALRFADRGEHLASGMPGDDTPPIRNVRPLRFGGFPGVIRTVRR